jgi:hypothetical protein
MPEPYREITPAQFADLLDAYPKRRKIDAIHLHHTWRPNHSQWKGLATVQSMARYHISLGWGDIAQHVTLDPHGMLWTGRDWNAAPASAKGYNGNESSGPFMIEMIGDFDKGKDPFQDPQKAAAIDTLVHLLREFGLKVENIRFHNEMSKKTCPGTAIDKKRFLGDVAAALKAAAPRAAVATPFRQNVAQYLLDTTEEAPRGLSMLDAEPLEEAETYDESAQRTILTSEDADAARGETLTTATLTTLVPHVVNMREGKFAATQSFLSSEATVDEIFDKIEERIAKRAPGDPLRIVLHAHGGLINEAGGLAIAAKHVWWWNNNDVYPLYFVWQTGLGATIADALRRARDRMLGRRAFDPFEFTTDLIIAGLVHVIGGVQSWDGMKFTASAASAEGGAAAYVVQKLVQLQQNHGGKFELHATGHSAGAIFHSYFVPLAVANQVKFKTLQFLAPAVRVDEYQRRLARLLANRDVGDLTIYTMRRDLERKDTTSPLYRKSLLYLISHGLEHDLNAEILGLEDSIKKDKALARSLGIGAPSANARVVWSITKGESESTSHGAFDDDPPTMTSVARRVLGGEPKQKYPEKEISRAVDPWELSFDVPPELEDLFPNGLPVAQPSFEASPPPPPPSSPQLQIAQPAVGPPPPLAAAGGRRRALCVGINAYASAPLSGCVADAQRWASQLQAIGFEPPRMLIDGQATRQGILDALDDLFAKSSPGDVLVFQAAGHGTTVPDLNGDEPNGQDQAFCPYDFQSGALLIDDDVADLFTRVPPGVLLTCFFDFCHSGTATRFAVGRTSGVAGSRARFIPPTTAIVEAHVAFRGPEGKRAAPTAQRGPDFMREVVFSACRPDEVAWESGGAGDFTRNVAPLLARWDTMTNEDFQNAIGTGFTPVGRQHPILDCSPAARRAPFLGGTGQSTAGRSAGADTGVARALRDLASALESGSR